MTSKLMQYLKDFIKQSNKMDGMKHVTLTVSEVKEILHLIDEQDTIEVEVRGGVAYCNDPRIKIIDYD